MHRIRAEEEVRGGGGDDAAVDQEEERSPHHHHHMELEEEEEHRSLPHEEEADQQVLRSHHRIRHIHLEAWEEVRRTLAGADRDFAAKTSCLRGGSCILQTRCSWSREFCGLLEASLLIPSATRPKQSYRQTRTGHPIDGPEASPHTVA